ncbi:MAG: PEP-CTERM sorting domain-containing protein [Lacipirellulaceae bacterium]
MPGKVGAEDIANFWISTRDAGPEVQTIQVLAGGTTTFDIWARPATGETLSAFSLNLVSTQSATLDFQSIEVYNPTVQVLPTVERHQLVFDTSEGLAIGVPANYIEAFSGLSILDGSSGLSDSIGIGPSCDMNDAHCSDASGDDSWRVATVTYMAGAAGTTTDLYLEIGTQGLWHDGGTPTDSSAVFGLATDTVHRWDTSGGQDNRDIYANTIGAYVGLGLADATIDVVAMLDSADFNSSTFVDGIDLLIWQRGFGSGTMFSEGDADHDSMVDADDLVVWQNQYGSVAVALPVVVAVPEPSSIWLLCLVLSSFLVSRF